MAKSNAQKQREYRERKKLNDGNFLEKERRRQKKYYIPVENLSKSEHKKRKESIRSRVKKSRDESKTLLQRAKELISQSSPIPSCDSSTVSDSQSFVVRMPFPAKGNSSRKGRLLKEQRNRREVKHLQNKNSQLQKRNATLRKRLQREQKKLKPRNLNYHLLHQKVKRMNY